MTLKKLLENYVDLALKTKWTIRNGNVVPDEESIKLGNDGVYLDATILYADISDSTFIVDNKIKEYAAGIYKSFLFCASRIIKDRGGIITAYDGDRVMAVFIGDQKNSNAVQTALKISYAVQEIINPKFNSFYTNHSYFKNVIGIDTSKLLVANTGLRGNKDLVWIGRAANYAAKLCSLPDQNSIYITEDVYRKLNDKAKYCNDSDMWFEVPYKINGINIYSTTYYWIL